MPARYTYQIWSGYEERWKDMPLSAHTYKAIKDYCSSTWMNYRIFDDGLLVETVEGNKQLKEKSNNGNNL